MSNDKTSADLDLDLLRKLAEGTGGRRTGALIREGYIRVEVTDEGRAALRQHAAEQNPQRVIHELKTWPASFSAVLSGRKTYEVRRCDDRSFAIGDLLRLREFAPRDKKYTGRVLEVAVTYMTHPVEFGLPENLCVMGIRVNQFWKETDQ